MAKPVVGRTPNDETRTRRALQNVADILNDLVRSGEIALGADGKWTTGGSSAGTLAAAVFGAKVVAPAQPRPDEGQVAMAGRVFGPKVAYGVVG